MTDIPAVPPSSAFDVRIAEFTSDAATRNAINETPGINTLAAPSLVQA
jgi:hypothetical protein